MRHLVFALALVASTFASASALWAADDTERVSRTVALEPGGTLRLKSFSGRVTITGSDRRDVAIEAVRRAPREKLDAIRLEIRTEGPGLVTIEENRRDQSWFEFRRSSVVETDFDIQVPRRTNLDVSVFRAPVTIAGVEGTQKVHSFSSQLRVEDASGSIHARTFSGSVAIKARTWEPNQQIDVHTFSGDVELQVPDSTRANLSFNSFRGRLNSDLPMTLNSSSRRALRARLGAPDGAAGELKVKTFSGNLRILR